MAKKDFQLTARVDDHRAGTVLSLEVGDDGLPTSEVYRIRSVPYDASADKRDGAGLTEKEAKGKAGQIVKEAQEKADQIVKDAEAKAAQMTEKATADVAAMLDAANKG